MPGAAAAAVAMDDTREQSADMSGDEEEVALPLMEEEGMEGTEEVEEEAPRINVDIPRCVAELGSELFFVKLPNFLSVETRYVSEAAIWRKKVFSDHFSIYCRLRLIAIKCRSGKKCAHSCQLVFIRRTCMDLKWAWLGKSARFAKILLFCFE